MKERVKEITFGIVAGILFAAALTFFLYGCGVEPTFTVSVPDEEIRWRGNVMDSDTYRDDFLKEVACLQEYGYIRKLDLTPFILVVTVHDFNCGPLIGADGCYDSVSNTAWVSTQYGDDHRIVRHETVHWAGYGQDWHDRGPFIVCNPFFVQ